MHLKSIGANPAGIVILIVAAVATFVAVTWWASREERAASAPTNPAIASSTPAFLERARDAQPNERVAKSATDEEAAASEQRFSQYVAGKYRFLKLSTQLSAALVARERLATEIRTAVQGTDEAAKERLPGRRTELADLDRKIGGLLEPRDLAGFEILKDSDIEQFQFDDYVGGISNVAPLKESDKQGILYAKLVHRRRFRQVLDDSGLMRGDLTTAQRQFVFADVSRALRESKAGFLQEVRQYLYDEEQFRLLSNYENSEDDAELEKLRRIAHGE